MKNQLLLGSALLALMVATTAFADTAPVSDGVEVDEVVVVAKGQTRAIQTIKGSDLQAPVSGTSVLKVVDKLPGVSFQSADPFGAYEWSTRISIRGFNQNQLGFTLDGVPLGDMSYSNHNGLHISRAITQENLGRVELAQGSGSLSTASTSNLGGTLQFFSRNPSDKMSGELDVTGGSNKTQRVFARFETGEIAQLGGLKAYVSALNADTVKWRTGQGHQKQRQYDFKAVLPIGQGNLTGFYTRSERREADYQDLSLEMIGRLGDRFDNFSPNWGAAIAAATAYNTGKPLPAPLQTIDDAYYAGAGIRNDDLYGATLNLPINTMIRFEGTAYAHKNRGQGLWYTPYLASPGYGMAGSDAAPLSIRTTEYDIDRQGVTGAVIFTLADHQIKLGGWYENNDFHNARRFYAETLNKSRNELDFQSNWFFTQWDYKFNTETVVGYVQDSWKILPNLKLDYGFKAMSVQNKVNTIAFTPAYNKDGSIKQSGKIAGTIKAEKSFLPQIGAVYEVQKGLEVFGSYSENMRAYVASATDGPFSVLDQDSLTYLTSKVKPEQSKTFEGGLRYQNNDYQVSATVYHVDFSNRLLAIQQGSAIQGKPPIIQNVGSVETNGIELAGQYRLPLGFSIYGAYTYNNSEYQDNVVDRDGKVVMNTKGKTVVNTPENLFKGELRYRSEGLWASLGTSYTGDRYYTYENIGGKVKASIITDLAIGYNFSGSTLLNGLSVQANVTNLFDNHYISTIGSAGFAQIDPTNTNATVLPGAPRQIFFSVKKAF